MITHQPVQKAITALKAAGQEGKLVFILRPGVKMTDTTRLLLVYENVEIVRDPAAPIDHYYLIDKKEYQKYE